jgi:DNA-directed RNA polymerase omega subunit
MKQTNMAEDFDLNEAPEEQEIADVVVDPKKIPKIDSKYRLILLTAQRAKQIQRGARARVDLDPRKIKPTTIARAEFDAKKVNFEITKEK